MTQDTDCKFTRIGDEATPDGGYLICENFVKHSEGIINIGVNGYDNFGCQLSTMKRMPNHMFDCTNPRVPPCGSNGGNNHFSYVCVGEVSEKTTQKEFNSLADMIKANKLFKRHIFLKIDCEGGEFPAFKYFPVELLDYVDQMVGELHFDNIYREEWGMLDIFRTLMTKFVSVNLHMNNWGCMRNRKLKSRAVEFSLVNRNIIKLRSQSRSYAQHPLNKPNGRVPDCQMT